MTDFYKAQRSYNAEETTGDSKPFQLHKRNCLVHLAPKGAVKFEYTLCPASMIRDGSALWYESALGEIDKPMGIPVGVDVTFFRIKAGPGVKCYVELAVRR